MKTLEQRRNAIGEGSNPVPRSVSLLVSSKIETQHLARLAVVYVRQSSARQVRENIESTQLQYDLASLVQSYGWPDNRIEIIDDDLGVSGKSLEGRSGFRRLLAEISLAHVGLVMGIEMSRLARNCRDWHQLLELCAVFGTLLGDADGIYNPREHNDRLLLGLKGSAHAVLRFFHKEAILIGRRVPNGPRPGDMTWKRANSPSPAASSDVCRSLRLRTQQECHRKRPQRNTKNSATSRG